MVPLRFLLPLLAVVASPVAAFNYAVTGAGEISLKHIETGIPDILTIFTGEANAVSVSGVEWEALGVNETTDDYTLYWETAVGGVTQQTGTYDLSGLEDRELPYDIECGSLTIDDKGRHTITVTLKVDTSEADTSREYQAYAAGVSIIPLLVVLVLAMTTQMVEFSLFFAIFVGACMVAGNVKDGFFTLLDTYILDAIVNESHAFVYLFTLFLSGSVGMMEKSGGMIGFTRDIAKYATTARAGQCATFCIGCIVFFDDYANTLLAGQTMRPLTDLLFISREKLAFVVDATAAPIASIVPISSWVGFEVSLIEEEIAKIQEIYGNDLSIETSGLAVFLQSIKYRYYPIFMLILIPFLILSQRDFGPMLIAERKTQVYERTDGGDAAGREGDEAEAMGSSNEPREDTPKKSWNMLIPIVLLVFLIFYLLVKSGDDGTGEQSFMDKIESSDSYVALLYGTMATANLSTLFYWAQVVNNGELVLPTFSNLKACFSRNVEPSETVALKDSHAGDGAEEEDKAVVVHAVDEEDLTVPSRSRSLMSIFESVESFLYGMGRIFPALIVLTLAWASGAIMIAVGADRLFSKWITGGVSAEALPTLSFIISLFMALATGTSWGTMTILFPLICTPAYEVSNGNATIWYAVVAGILSGSVAGDHMSPISDTTVLSALATDCNLVAHVVTQAPYALAMSLVAILFGTIPIGRDTWPNIVGILLGAVAIALMVFGFCAPILSPTGRYDIFTQWYARYKGEDDPLHKLQNDTIQAYLKSRGEVVETPVAEEEEEKAQVVPEETEGLPVDVGSGTPEPSATKEDSAPEPSATKEDSVNKFETIMLNEISA